MDYSVLDQIQIFKYINKIFNKNTIKISYNCMDNMETVIKKQNQKVLNTSSTSTPSRCNCQNKDICQMGNNCLSSRVVFKANVITKEDTVGKNYINLTEGSFKQQYTYSAQTPFWNRNYTNHTDRLLNQMANSHHSTRLYSNNKAKQCKPLYRGHVS